MISTPMNTTIIPVNKAGMLAYHREDYLGYTLVSGDTALIWIRSDLPKRAYASVLAHEQQHAVDGMAVGSVLKREARAWWAGFKASPLGFFQAIFLSLTPSRLSLYLRRIRDNF